MATLNPCKFVKIRVLKYKDSCPPSLSHCGREAARGCSVMRAAASVVVGAVGAPSRLLKYIILVIFRGFTGYPIPIHPVNRVNPVQMNKSNSYVGLLFWIKGKRGCEVDG